jgi:hypothetical protein
MITIDNSGSKLMIICEGEDYHLIGDEYIKTLINYAVLNATNSTPSDLLESICYIFDIPKNIIQSSSRKKEIVTARHAFCLIASELLGLTYDAIGKYTLKTNHTTVMNSKRRAKHYLLHDLAFRELFFRLPGKYTRHFTKYEYIGVENNNEPLTIPKVSSAISFYNIDKILANEQL